LYRSAISPHTLRKSRKGKKKPHCVAAGAGQGGSIPPQLVQLCVREIFIAMVCVEALVGFGVVSVRSGSRSFRGRCSRGYAGPVSSVRAGSLCFSCALC
jgi:hypothetical protein